MSGTLRFTVVFERSDGTQWLFMSGLVISLAGNVCVAALAPRPSPPNFPQLLLAGGCFLIASVFLASVGWILHRFEFMSRTEESSPKHAAEVKARLVVASLRRLSAMALSGLLLGIAAMVTLVL